MDYDTNGTAPDETEEHDEGAGMNEMQRLLDEQGASFRTIKRGDVVEGQIVRIDPEEILVDIGLKSEGVLSTKELPSSGYGSLSELQVGDNVLVYVMQPETPEGHAIVSIRRARLERQWRIAQEQYERGELLEAEVIDHNKGGLIVNLEGIRGFVPISQILNLKREDSADNAETQTKLQGMVGRHMQLKIIEINRNRNRLILSERLAVQEWRQRRREELLNELTVGEVRKGVVSNLANFGAFVDLGGADGLVHISQLAWSRVNHPSEVLRVGQEVEVQVLSVDKEKKKIALSIKRAEVDPWTTVEQRYHPGQLVRGTITKIAPFGAFARIEDGIEGLIHLSELPAGMQDPKAALHEGQDVTVRILRIDAERRRLGLSIRQAQEGAEGEEAEAGAEPGAPSAEEAEQQPAAGAPAPAATATTQRRAEVEEPQTALAAAFRAAQAAQEREREQASAAAEPASTEAAAPAPPAPEAEAPSTSQAAVAPQVTEPAETTEAPAAAEAAEAAEATAPEQALEATAAEAPGAETVEPEASEVSAPSSDTSGGEQAVPVATTAEVTPAQTAEAAPAAEETAAPEEPAPTASRGKRSAPEAAAPEQESQVDAPATPPTSQAVVDEAPEATSAPASAPQPADAVEASDASAASEATGDQPAAAEGATNGQLKAETGARARSTSNNETPAPATPEA